MYQRLASDVDLDEEAELRLESGAPALAGSSAAAEPEVLFDGDAQLKEGKEKLAGRLRLTAVAIEWAAHQGGKRRTLHYAQIEGHQQTKVEKGEAMLKINMKPAVAGGKGQSYILDFTHPSDLPA